MTDQYLCVTCIQKMWSQYIPEGGGRSEKKRLREKKTKSGNERQRERKWSIGRNLNKINCVSSNLRCYQLYDSPLFHAP